MMNEMKSVEKNRRNLRYNENRNSDTKRQFVSGEIYWAKLPELDGDSQVQQGIRPVVILVNNMAGKHSKVVQYIPLTTRTKKDLPVHYKLENGDIRQASIALGEQVAIIDTFRLEDKIGYISEEDLFMMETIALKQLGINVYEYIAKLKMFKNRKLAAC